ncbi:MAG: hypothetical protein ACXVB4_16385 [Pseudobdellovibrionaceae bacterium]
MKSLISTLFTVLFTMSAFAGEAKILKDRDADQLLNALTRADAYIACTTMPCSTVTSKISCSAMKASAVECNLNVQSDENGTLVHNQVTGERAQELTAALRSAGIMNCGPEGCTGSADTIRCTLLNPETDAESTTQCAIEGTRP